VAGAPHITFPLTGSKLLTEATGPGGDQIKLIADGGHRPYRWLVDGRPVTSPPFAREAAWQPEGEGFSTVTVIDATGKADEVKVRVESRHGVE
jgi:penicillin-binding protein 1C